MKKITKNKGITLVSLVVTIIILLILAGITISQLTGSGLFENAKLAEQKSQEAQEKENTTLADYENKIGEYVDGSRDVNNNMCSPIHIMEVIIGDNTSSSTIQKGNYVFSSYKNLTIETSSQYENYLSKNQDGTWKVLKSGWYFIGSQNLLSNITADTWSEMSIKINDKLFTTLTGRQKENTIYENDNSTIYLEKDDHIDFIYYIYSHQDNITYTYNRASFTINAMSK